MVNTFIRKSSLFCSVMMASVLCALSVSVVFAGNVEIEDKNPIWKAGIDGVEIEWNADGSVRRITSQISQTVQIPDKRGIRKAQRIAEEKAKAAIVRWLKQDSFSVVVISEIQTDLETARSSLSDGNEFFSKDNVRSMTESLSEVVGSTASGELRGVITLERGYDAEESEAWVKVGISERTINAVGQVGKMLAGQKKNKEHAENETAQIKQGGKTNFKKESSELEKLNDDNW